MSRDPVRIGVAGLGRMGQIYSRHLAFAVPSARLVAVCDPVESSRIEVAAALKVPGFTEFAEMLPLVDAVVIATPTSTHREARALCALVISKRHPCYT